MGYTKKVIAFLNSISVTIQGNTFYEGCIYNAL